MGSSKSKNLNQRDELLNLIVGGSPDGSVTGLNSLFALGTPESLLSAVIDVASDPATAGLTADAELAQASNDAIGSDPVSQIVKRLVLDTVKGAHLTRDLVTEFAQQVDSSEDVDDIKVYNDVLAIYGSQDVADKLGTVPINTVLGINSDSGINANEPTKDSPGLAAYVVKPVGISPATKNIAALSLFMNTIPTIEINRAVPYVELTMQVARPSVSADGRLNAPSQLKTILGAATVEEGTADFSMATAASGTLDGADDEPGAVAGMELFMSPQTMAPVGAGGSGFDGLDTPSLRPTAVLDPFRPLISIDTVKIDVASTTGFMSFKSATIDMILHDRSRLSEVADFVKPDLFSKTEFLMEYGWHHPDGEDYTRNPFGALLNAMRVKEKYGIVNSSFSLQDDGSMRISLKLAMKGANEYRTTQIGNSEDVQDSLKYIQQLEERVGELRSALNSQQLSGKKSSRSVLGSQILSSAQSTTGNPIITGKQRRAIRNVIDRLGHLGDKRGNEKAKELSKVLEELYFQGRQGENAPNGAVKRFKSAVAAEVDRKFTNLNGLSSSQLLNPGTSTINLVDPGDVPADIAVDPFLDLKRLELKDLKAVGKTSKFVTFGKVFMKFVAEPLAATGRFDDVQVLFYPMNNGAGKARNKSCASFLIPRADLMREFQTFHIGRRAANVSLGEFQNFINQTFIDNVANPSYGMATIYRRVTDNGTVRIRPNANFKGKDKDAVAATKAEAILVDAGIPSGVFRPPHLDLHIEALPARMPKGGEGKDGTILEDKTILRIHVFDKATSAYETQAELIRATTDAQLNTVGYIDNTVQGDQARMNDNAKTILEAAQKLKVIEEIPGSDIDVGDGESPVYKHFRITGGPREVKNFVMSTVPYIIYGSQNTAVESLALASIQDPALSTVNILRTDRAGAITPEGSGRGGVPLKTIPARADISCLGCPLISFMQQFFVDAQTGSDLDNIYAITQLNHTIDATSFRSSFEMVPQQAYGKYESTINKTEQAIAILEEFAKGSED